MRPSILFSMIVVPLFVACGGDAPRSGDTSPAAGPATPAGGVEQPQGSAPVAAAPAAAPTTAAAGSTTAPTGPDGATIYQRCAACHQANGIGVPNTFPPLAGSEIATGPAARPIGIVLHGLSGPIVVRGETFNSAMPPYGTGVPMSDAEVAAVLTYVRQSWGNSAPPVSAADVARVRAGG
jgi:mono/diheme cytochrome c family protein